MRDDFDPVLADRFTVLDQVPVPDTWSRVLDQTPVPDTLSLVRRTEEVPIMTELETKVPTEPHRRKGPTPVIVAGILAAAAVVAIALVVTRDGDDAVAPADEPPPTVSVPPPPPPRALFGQPGERLASGTYFVDEVDGTPTPRIFVTVGTGWVNTRDKWGIGKDDTGFVTFSRPPAVFSDACHSSDGFHPGPVTTLDGLVGALSEQGGWVDVTTPSDITVDGYAGKAFQRTAPAEFVDCSTAFAPFRSWEYDDPGGKGWSYYEPGETETLWVLDVEGTVIVLNTRFTAGRPVAAQAELAAMLDSIRIDRG
ncbi:MAG: hypothetical protein ACR2HP_02475 [Ilumatobacteraceae bacterium]